MSLAAQLADRADLGAEHNSRRLEYNQDTVMSSFPTLSEPLMRLVDEAKREQDPALVDRIARGVFEGDPLADRLVASFKEMSRGGGWQPLDRALQQRLAARWRARRRSWPSCSPPALRPRPNWVDLELVDAGANAYWRSGGLNLGLALICGSLALRLPERSRSTRPLAATGRLEKMAPRRIQETSRWVGGRDPVPAPCVPAPRASARTVRLRLVHALVRQPPRSTRSHLGPSPNGECRSAPATRWSPRSAAS